VLVGTDEDEVALVHGVRVGVADVEHLERHAALVRGVEERRYVVVGEPQQCEPAVEEVEDRPPVLQARRPGARPCARRVLVHRVPRCLPVRSETPMASGFSGFGYGLSGQPEELMS